LGQKGTPGTNQKKIALDYFKKKHEFGPSKEKKLNNKKGR